LVCPSDAPAGLGAAGGILTLTFVVGHHWHALVRDVLDLGYRVRDIFTELTLEEMVAIVVAAPPQSSVRHALDAGWSREAHLLANLTEQNAGLTDISEPYSRPGLEDRDPPKPVANGVLTADVMTWAEMDALDAERDARGASGQSGNTTVRTW